MKRTLAGVGLSNKDRPQHSSLPRASVLVPLFFDEADGTDDQPRLLLTQRPMRLSSHPGEVCFPGGRQEPSDDGDDVTTALREVPLL